MTTKEELEFLSSEEFQKKSPPRNSFHQFYSRKMRKM